MLTPLRSSSLVLVMISSISVPICSFFTLDELIAAKRHFLRGQPSLRLACACLLEPMVSVFWLLKSMLNAELFIGMLSWFLSSCFGTIHSQNVSQPKIAKKFTKNLYFAGSRSSMLINLNSASPVLVMICSKSVPICNRFHTASQWWQKYDFLWGIPLWWCPLRGTPSPNCTKFCH